MREKKLYEVFNPYSCIGKDRFLGNVLDVGAGNLDAQLHSKNKTLIETAISENRYIAIDLPTDIREYETDEKFDTILCMQMIAYLPHADWKPLFDKFKRWLKPNGILIIAESFDRSQETTYNKHHQTFNIRAESFANFFPDAEYYVIRSQKRMCIRWGIKKMLIHMLRKSTRHIYIHGNRMLFMLWLKEEREGEEP